MRKLFISFLILAVFTLPASAKNLLAYAGNFGTYDVAVVGGGCGGCAAAIQAARQGVRVIVLEPTDMLGGQMTAGAVSTMDDRGLTRTGIYKEFIDNVQLFYNMRDKRTDCCYWGGDTIAFEPAVGADILKKMLQSAKVEVVYNAKPISVRMDGNVVTSAIFETANGKREVYANQFIDATECGDLIPLTPARFRAGNSISPNIDDNSVIQDITYVAIVKKYPNGLPEELVITSMPPGYVKYIDEFRAVVTKDGHSWPDGYPYNIPTHNEYRALPDLESKLNVAGDDPTSWENVTKTCINWANDYPGMTYGNKQKSLPVTYLTDRKKRNEINKAAMEKTLCFLYYMQHELGMTDWSVSDEGYKQQIVSWQKEKKLAPYAEVLKHFPCQPYIRESRRLVGVKTVTVKDILRDIKLKRTKHSISDSIALGEYPIDVHGMIEDKYLEADLGETKTAIPNDWVELKAGLFQIPMGALIPEKVDGLLAAEKNISVSRTVNGATRLQPITMLTGQAAGALAALAASKDIEPREEKVENVQKQLLKSGDKLTMQTFIDVSERSDLWKYIEFAMLHGYIIPHDEHRFGVNMPVTFFELRECIYKLFGLRDKRLDIDPFVTINCHDASIWLFEIGLKQTKYQAYIKELDARGAAPLTKADVAKLIWIMTE